MVRPSARVVKRARKDGTKASRTELLRSCAKHLAGPFSAKVLNHAGFISPYLLDGLNALDPSLHNARLLGFVNTSQSLRTFLYLNRTLERILPDVRFSDARRALLQVRSYSAIGDWFDRWLKEAAFPSPPWNGTSRLAPMTTCEQLDKATARFENCLRTQIAKVVLGTHYFYELARP